ncbi:MAG TPA: ABC transporter transmembrane domain-containing protein [Longimicrobiaceae bacterium]|nr:ABC transporter transmembrane domain-containing protein [Longimicrobiaceae bacterium]
MPDSIITAAGTTSRRTFWQKLKGGQMRELLPRLRPHAGAIGIATLMLLVSSALGLAFPWIVGKIFDGAFMRGNGRALDRIALTLLGLITLQAGTSFVQSYLLSATGERVIAKLRKDLFGHLLTLPPAFFADRRTGELTSRLGADVQMLQGVLTMNITELFRLTLTLVAVVIILIIKQPLLTAVTMGIVPLVVGTSWYLGERLKKTSLGVMDQIAEATAVAEEAFSQIRVVQSFVREDFERARYGARMDRAVAAALRRSVTRGVFFSMIGFTTLAASVVVLWMGGRMVLAGTLTVGTLVSFLLYAGQAAQSVGAMGQLWSMYQEATGAAGRVFEILNARPKLRDPEQPRTLPSPVRGAIEFRDVWFRYERPAELPSVDQGGPEVAMAFLRMLGAAPLESAAKSSAPPEWVLRGVSLCVAPGETVALVGPSGAGKTTLAALIPRFWDVQEGSITVDGVDVREMRIADLRTAVGLVPQETLLFSSSVRENIGYGRPDAGEEEVFAAARAAHAHEFIQLLQEGYDTKVGERGIKLSGGQRQRVSIARAILKDPAVLILDEATSSLDTESEALIEDALNHLLKGRTTLIIAHRLSTVRRADRVLVLDRGQIVEEGTHAELLALGGLYARLYARQFREDDARPVDLLMDPAAETALAQDAAEA